MTVIQYYLHCTVHTVDGGGGGEGIQGLFDSTPEALHILRGTVQFTS